MVSILGLLEASDCVRPRQIASDRVEDRHTHRPPQRIPRGRVRSSGRLHNLFGHFVYSVFISHVLVSSHLEPCSLCVNFSQRETTPTHTPPPRAARRAPADARGRWAVRWTAAPAAAPARSSPHNLARAGGGNLSAAVLYRYYVLNLATLRALLRAPRARLASGGRSRMVTSQPPYVAPLQ